MHIKDPLLAPHLSELITENDWVRFALQLELLCAGTLLSLLILLLELRRQVLPTAGFTANAWLSCLASPCSSVQELHIWSHFWEVKLCLTWSRIMLFPASSKTIFISNGVGILAKVTAWACWLLYKYIMTVTVTLQRRSCNSLDDGSLCFRVSIPKAKFLSAFAKICEARLVYTCWGLCLRALLSLRPSNLDLVA